MGCYFTFSWFKLHCAQYLQTLLNFIEGQGIGGLDEIWPFTLFLSFRMNKWWKIISHDLSLFSGEKKDFFEHMYLLYLILSSSAHKSLTSKIKTILESGVTFNFIHTILNPGWSSCPYFQMIFQSYKLLHLRELVWDFHHCPVGLIKSSIESILDHMESEI